MTNKMTKEEAIKWLYNLTVAIGEMRYQDLWVFSQAIEEIAQMIADVPDKDVRENIHGEWERSKAKIYAYDSEFGELYEYVIPCSCCGETHTIDCSEIPNELPNFCPSCGADMRR